MQLTSIKAPAPAYLEAHGTLLTQLGAAKVEATDGYTVKATYFNNEKAVNAAALLKDTIWGASLVVDNQSKTADAPVASSWGIAELLKGVEGLKVQTAMPRCPGGDSYVFASSTDESLVRLLQDLVKTEPAPHVHVNVDVAVPAPTA